MLNKVVNLTCIVVLITISIFSSNVVSETLYTECDYCASDYEFNSVAKFVGRTSSSLYNNDVYVMNFSTGEIKLFGVIGERAEPGLPAYSNVTEKTLSNSIQNNFRIASNERNSLQDFFYHNEVPSSLASSAYDLVAQNYLQREVGLYYEQNQSVRQMVGNYTQALLAVLGKVVDANFGVVLSFSDGSTAYFKIAGIFEGGGLVFELESAVDADNNPIALSANGYNSGNYNFTSQGEAGISNFMQALQRLGIPVYRVTSGSSGKEGGENSSSLSCSQVGERLLCEFRKRL